MNLDEVVAELLAGPVNEFTSRRNSKAKELRAAGQRELAAEVATLKKPPVSVWAVNQLARRNKPVLERVRRAGEAVVQAQSGAVAGRKSLGCDQRPMRCDGSSKWQCERPATSFVRMDMPTTRRPSDECRRWYGWPRSLAERHGIGCNVARSSAKHVPARTC